MLSLSNVFTFQIVINHPIDFFNTSFDLVNQLIKIIRKLIRLIDNAVINQADDGLDQLASFTVSPRISPLRAFDAFWVGDYSRGAYKVI